MQLAPIGHSLKVCLLSWNKGPEEKLSVHIHEIPPLSHHPQKPHLQHHKHHPSGWVACLTSSTLLVLMIPNGGGRRWKVVIGGGQAELIQDGMVPCFVISPVFFSENGSEFALLALCAIHSSPILPPSFCSPRCFFPLHSVLYYCQVNIPEVKIRSHQLDSTLPCIIARLIFPK